MECAQRRNEPGRPASRSPTLCELVHRRAKKVLTVRPGITDLSSIAYRDEEELLARQVNPRTYYLEVVLPHKLSLNAEYIRDISLKNDLSLITKTLFQLFFNRPRYTPSVVNR